MPRLPRSAVEWTSLSTALTLSAIAFPAHAGDVSDELTVGALSSNVAPTQPYVSDRFGGSADPSEAVSLSLSGTYTRYFRADRTPGENIFQLAAAGDYTPNDHWSFGAELRGSPPSTAVMDTPAGVVRSRTSVIGCGVNGEYDTAGEGPLETIVDGYLGLSSYSTTQRARTARKGTPSSLAQYRVSADVTEVFFRHTEGELSGSYYAYSTDPEGTGYFGTSVFGRESVSEGLPLEPLRWSLRPTVRQRIGPVKLSAFFQYGRYVGDAGWNFMAGLKAQVKVSTNWKLWAALNLQRDFESTGETLTIPWGSVGARVSF
jgi:hypothetical protein